MPRTRSQEALELEAEPQRVSGIPPWTAGFVIGVVVLIMAIALGGLVGSDWQIGPAPQVTLDPFGVTTRGQPAPAPAPAPGAPPGEGQAYNTLVAGDALLLPLPPAGLGPFSGQAVRGVGVLVYAVVADEGFWVGEDRDQRIYVAYQTIAGLESPPDIDAGQRVTFDGVVEPLPADLASRFRITEEEGAGQLQQQGYFISTGNVAIAEDP